MLTLVQVFLHQPSYRRRLWLPHFVFPQNCTASGSQTPAWPASVEVRPPGHRTIPAEHCLPSLGPGMGGVEYPWGDWRIVFLFVLFGVCISLTTIGTCTDLSPS